MASASMTAPVAVIFFTVLCMSITMPMCFFMTMATAMAATMAITMLRLLTAYQIHLISSGLISQHFRGIESLYSEELAERHFRRILCERTPANRHEGVDTTDGLF